jgi:hypothetical protein
LVQVVLQVQMVQTQYLVQLLQLVAVQQVHLQQAVQAVQVAVVLLIHQHIKELVPQIKDTMEQTVQHLLIIGAVVVVAQEQ